MHANKNDKCAETTGGSFQSIRTETLVLSEDGFYRRRHILSSRFLTGVFVVVILVHVAVMTMVQIFSIRYSFKSSAADADGVCMIGWEYVPHYVISFMYTLVVLPFLSYQMRDVNDAYGIRREMFSICILTSFSTMLLILFLYLVKLQLLSAVVSVIYGLTVISPLLDSYSITIFRWPWLFNSKSNLPYTREAMEMLLNDPILFNQFKLFSVTDFTLECVLFYECCHNSLVTGDEEVLKEIYLNFVHPDAKFQINLSEQTRSELDSLVRQNRYERTMYLNAERDIQDLMYVNTFSRYVQHNQDSKLAWEQV
ncbi:hypothetical protein K493DRAFT_359568 [Basidiobolus meristosporus CBS 931.73]|uniref:RGS domain-containing protein n=1 Tax=Basidiobolus meristosporus CBS 931.73 TaxID=1314790 RepID=A0A1Y1XRP7_9FUNG|nr:hypothetical protein K493DRAFT_359568 [Basidiobolus meristosporus CBS 931.73]|eukprot:ORX88431.1 hypothetical protein K493DRAFT_359568 [Basidiobolus meristosporus CBS 931.73]